MSVVQKYCNQKISFKSKLLFFSVSVQRLLLWFPEMSSTHFFLLNASWLSASWVSSWFSSWLGSIRTNGAPPWSSSRNIGFFWTILSNWAASFTCSAFFTLLLVCFVAHDGSLYLSLVEVNQAILAWSLPQ